MKKAYPLAKVILTTRDVRQWYDSMTKVIINSLHERQKWYMRLPRMIFRNEESVDVSL